MSWHSAQLSPRVVWIGWSFDFSLQLVSLESGKQECILQLIRFLLKCRSCSWTFPGTPTHPDPPLCGPGPSSSGYVCFNTGTSGRFVRLSSGQCLCFQHQFTPSALLPLCPWLQEGESLQSYICCWELLAQCALLLLLHRLLPPEHPPVHILFRCDNATAEAASWKGCRWPKASDSATFLRLQEWRKIFVSIEHVPGFENSDADAVSRGSVPALYSASWQRTISPFLGTISCPPDSPVIPGFRFFAICNSGLSWYLAVFRVPVKPCSIGLWISGHTNLRPVRFRRTFEILRISGSGSRSETGPA